MKLTTPWGTWCAPVADPRELAEVVRVVADREDDGARVALRVFDERREGSDATLARRGAA